MNALKTRLHAVFLSLMTLSLVHPVAVLASGSGSGGYGDNAGVFGTHNQNFNLSSSQSLNDEQRYLLGREIYSAKLGCEGCELGSEPLNAKLAGRVMSEPDLMAKLDKKERAMVEVYLKRRFRL
ncbi:hypothetical protein [Nevskia sp.]|uniref:hypothetical protein n=1 Tax=Nevskia sp. TaxID=1929292 RepID=UPI0025ED50A9|nr:hypothetical protein [Nevskia sp.]